MSDGIEAIKQIHAFGEYNTILIAIYVVVLLTLGKVGINKLIEIWGIETKSSLYKKAQEERIETLEQAVKDLTKELDNRDDKLYQKQKGYHEQSIQIRNELKKNQEGLSTQISDLSQMMSSFINTQNDRTVASFRSSLWRMHKDFTNQGYVTPDGLKTFMEMGKLYEASGGNDVYHEKLLPEVESLEIHYPDGSIYSQKKEFNMRNINWTVRIKNKAFWIALVPAVLLLIQVVAAVFGITIDLGDMGNKLLAVVNAVFAVLTILGVVTDPTTNGITDSKQALEYTEPKRDDI